MWKDVRASDVGSPSHRRAPLTQPKLGLDLPSPLLACYHLSAAIWPNARLKRRERQKKWRVSDVFNMGLAPPAGTRLLLGLAPPAVALPPFSWRAILTDPPSRIRRGG